jgi:hypothetical protein
VGAAVNVVTAIWGEEKYDERYVNALRAQVPGIIVLGRDRPLHEPGRLRGWWCKLEVFAPWNADIRPCLFLDLDTFVLGDIRPLLAVDPERLWLIKNFYMPEKSNSGLFVAPDNELSDRIFEGSARLDTHSYGRGAGDGDYLAALPHRRLTDQFTDILSYKKDQLYESPKNARIVCFHGFPKPHECQGWAKEFFDARST